LAEKNKLNGRQGKINQDDEGELELKIAPYKRRVIMSWGKSVHGFSKTSDKKKSCGSQSLICVEYIYPLDGS
jgi:hypothetical protein